MTKKSKQKELLRWNKRHFSLFLKGCLPKIVTDLKVRLWNRKLVLSSSENVRKNIPFQMFYHADDIASSVLFTNRKPRILLLKLLGCFKQLEPGDFQRFVSITKQALMVLSSSSTGKKKQPVLALSQESFVTFPSYSLTSYTRTSYTLKS